MMQVDKKIILKVYVGDCEFSDVFYLEFETLEDATTAQEALEKSHNVIDASIKE